MSLKNVKVGDELVVTYVNARDGEPKTYPVTKVGRKYVTAGGYEFEIDSGRWNNKDYASHRYAYTEADWARVKLESRFYAAIRDLANAACRRAAIRSMSDNEVRAQAEAFEALAQRFNDVPPASPR